MSKFEVHHYTLCDGWVNTWSIESEDGSSLPEQFDSYEDALASLDDFLADEQWEFEQGNISDVYERDEFKIVEVTK